MLQDKEALIEKIAIAICEKDFGKGSCNIKKNKGSDQDCIACKCYPVTYAEVAVKALLSHGLESKLETQEQINWWKAEECARGFEVALLKEALELLLEAKHIKDTFGKDVAYEQLKERGWKAAETALKKINNR